MTVALFRGAALSLIWNTLPAFAYMAFPKQMTDKIDALRVKALDQLRAPNCMKNDCKDLQEYKLHLREIKALKDFSYASTSFFVRPFYVSKNQEFLRFEEDNPKEKFLFLSSLEDHNGALDPAHITTLVTDIIQKYDMKYAVAGSLEDVCHEVKQAAQVGKLMNVLLHGHGNQDGVCLSHPTTWEGWIHENTDLSKCFEGLDVNGRITLLGSYTGQAKGEDESNNIAQKIANASKRMVVAPVNTTYSSQVKIAKLNDFEVLQKPDDPKKGKNIFKAFYPMYRKCYHPSSPQHNREDILVDEIKASRLAQTYLLQPESFPTLREVLGFCKDDPKEKLLFLSLEFDHNGALSPHWNPELFRNLADHYDFKFTVVKSFSDICHEVRVASKAGQFINLVIHGHGSQPGMDISWEAEFPQNIITQYHPLDTCFKGLDPQGKITLISCKTGAELEPEMKISENFATVLAQKTHKTVIAPNDLTYTNSIKVVSINPLEIQELSRTAHFPSNIYQKFEAKS